MSDAIPIRVDLAGPTRSFRRFWHSTGFSPAELLLEPEMQQTLAYVGGVPNRGIEYLRVHYMLDLVTVPGPGPGRWDFTRLDQAIDAMLTHRIRPFFELMGNPSKQFTDFNDKGQVHRWRDFVVALAERCIARCGRDEVASWYFETWNEPDIWWRLGGETGFNNYYDACSEALKAVDPGLRLGGPGTARTLAPMFKSFLAHCDRGENFFTGETGVRLDFISVHEKGAKKHAEDLTPNTLNIVAKEMRAVDYIRAHHPRFAGLPFINNECDPQIGWILSHTWHGMPYFAGLIAKIVDQHQRLMVEDEGIDYVLLSNDNGFVGRWGHRTHLAYFGGREIKAAQAEHLTDLEALDRRRAAPEPFELVKKPALSVMELLALLGDRRLPVEAALDPDRNGLGAIATGIGAGEAAILLYNSTDRLWQSGESRVALDLEGLAPGRYALATFRIEPGKGDPFTVWEDLGAPDLPTAEELLRLRAAQEPDLAVEPLEIGAAGRHRSELTLTLPSAVLVVLVRDGAGLGAPVKLQRQRHAGLNGRTNTVLFWDRPAGGPPVQLYDLLWSATSDGPYEPVNPKPLLSTVHLHQSETGGGFYRVRARDLFGTLGPASEPLAG